MFNLNKRKNTKENNNDGILRAVKEVIFAEYEIKHRSRPETPVCDSGKEHRLGSTGKRSRAGNLQRDTKPHRKTIKYTRALWYIFIAGIMQLDGQAIGRNDEISCADADILRICGIGYGLDRPHEDREVQEQATWKGRSGDIKQIPAEDSEKSRVYEREGCGYGYNGTGIRDIIPDRDEFDEKVSGESKENSGGNTGKRERQVGRTAGTWEEDEREGKGISVFREGKGAEGRPVKGSNGDKRNISREVIVFISVNGEGQRTEGIFEERDGAFIGNNADIIGSDKKLAGDWSGSGRQDIKPVQEYTSFHKEGKSRKAVGDWEEVDNKSIYRRFFICYGAGKPGYSGYGLCEDISSGEHKYIWRDTGFIRNGQGHVFGGKHKPLQGIQNKEDRDTAERTSGMGSGQRYGPGIILSQGRHRAKDRSCRQIGVEEVSSEDRRRRYNLRSKSCHRIQFEEAYDMLGISSYSDFKLCCMGIRELIAGNDGENAKTMEIKKRIVLRPSVPMVS